MSLLDKKKEGNKAAEVAAKVAPEVEDKKTEPKFYIYSTPHSEAFQIHLKDGPKKAVNGVMKLTEDEHKEVEELIRKHNRYDISQNMRLLDADAAAEVARKHMEEEKARNGAARGMTSTMQTKAHMQTLEGHFIPNKLADLDVIEADAIHGEDTIQDPDGNNAKQ